MTNPDPIAVPLTAAMAVVVLASLLLARGAQRAAPN